MSIRAYKSSSLKCEYPFLIYPYKENKQKKVCIDFLIISQKKDCFEVQFNASGTQVLIYTKLPKIFLNKERILHADVGLQNNMSKAVAFEEVADPIVKNQKKTDNFHGPPQIVNLPYPCDTNIPIEHEVQAFESFVVPDEYGRDNFGDQQFHMILSIDLESKEKPERVVAKKDFRIFRSPGGGNRI